MNIAALEKVPWQCKEEWKFCRSHLFGNDLPMKRKALQHLYIWKIRNISLPAAVEGTMILMEVYLKENECMTESMEIFSTTMAFESWYSMAIMRFLNSIMDTYVGTKAADSMTTLAKKIDIPEWIISLRHTAAHGHSLPSLSSLREAVEYCLQWLYKNYWNKDICENVVVCVDSGAGEKFTLKCFYVCRLLNKYLKFGFEQMADLKIADREIVYAIFHKKLQNENTENFDGWNLEEIYKIALKRISRHVKKNPKHAENLVDSVLKSDDSLIHPSAVVNNVINNDMMNEWTDLLSIVCHSQGCGYLLHELLNITLSEFEESWRRECAAVYFNEIMESVLLSKLPTTDEKFRKQNKMKINLETSKKQRIKFTDFKLSDNDLMELLQKSLKDPNRFAKIFLKNLLGVFQECSFSSKFDKLSELIDIYTGNLITSENNGSAYSLKDLLGNMDQSSEENVDQHSPYEKEMNVEQDESIWSKVPLGCLPWQTESSHWLHIYESDD